MIEFFRKKNIKIGENCNIYSNICTPEPYLISIGNNVTIAPGCRFITHDNSVSKVIPNVSTKLAITRHNYSIRKNFSLI